MDSVKLHYEVSGDDFTRAGEASGDVKRVLKELGFDPDVVRNVSIAMYEGEINMVIHAGGGEIDEALSALVMLGFARSAAGKVLRAVVRESPSASVEELVRMALKRL